MSSKKTVELDELGYTREQLESIKNLEELGSSGVCVFVGMANEGMSGGMAVGTDDAKPATKKNAETDSSSDR